MADNDFSIDLTTPVGSVERYTQILEAYSDSTGKSYTECCYQTLQNTLKTLAKHTKTAHLSESDFKITETGYHPSWIRLKGQKVASLCVRDAGEHTVDIGRVKYFCGHITKAQDLKQWRIWQVDFKYADEKKSRIFVAMRTKSDVEKWAKTRIKNYLKRVGGLSATAFKLARGKLWRTQQSESNPTKKKIADNATEAFKRESNGTLTVTIRNKIHYAKLALEEGYSVKRAWDMSYSQLLGEAFRKTNSATRSNLYDYLKKLKNNFEEYKKREYDI